MKICVFGATGKTGRAFIDQALDAGHRIAAYARAPDKLADLSDKIAIIEGGLSDTDALRTAINGADIVVSTLGTTDRKPNTVLSDGTQAIIDAMKAETVSRFIVVTSLGCRESVKIIPSFLFRELVVKRIAKNIWGDKNRQEELVEQSGLAYTLVRPGGLTDEDGAGTYQALPQHDKPPKQIMVPRADVAKFLLDAAGDDTTIGKIFTLVA